MKTKWILLKDKKPKVLEDYWFLTKDGYVFWGFIFEDKDIIYNKEARGISCYALDKIIGYQEIKRPTVTKAELAELRRRADEK